MDPKSLLTFDPRRHRTPASIGSHVDIAASAHQRSGNSAAGNSWLEAFGTSRIYTTWKVGGATPIYSHYRVISQAIQYFRPCSVLRKPHTSNPFQVHFSKKQDDLRVTFTQIIHKSLPLYISYLLFVVPLQKSSRKHHLNGKMLWVSTC